MGIEACSKVKKNKPTSKPTQCVPLRMHGKCTYSQTCSVLLQVCLVLMQLRLCYTTNWQLHETPFSDSVLRSLPENPRGIKSL